VQAFLVVHMSSGQWPCTAEASSKRQEQRSGSSGEYARCAIKNHRNPGVGLERSLVLSTIKVVPIP
jgi:hypothetical protein